MLALTASAVVDYTLTLSIRSLLVHAALPIPPATRNRENTSFHAIDPRWIKPTMLNEFIQFPHNSP